MSWPVESMGVAEPMFVCGAIGAVSAAARAPPICSMPSAAAMNAANTATRRVRIDRLWPLIGGQPTMVPLRGGSQLGRGQRAVLAGALRAAQAEVGDRHQIL